MSSLPLRALALSLGAAATLAACGSHDLGTSGSGGHKKGSTSASGASGSTGSTATGSGTGGGGSGGAAPSPVPVETCPSTIPAPASGVCGVVKGSTTKVLRGRVVGPDHVYEGGEVVIGPTGALACVGCDCSATTGYAGATTLSCPGGVVSPALINTHDHINYAQAAPRQHSVMYDHRNEWRKGLNGKPALSVPPGSPVNEAAAWGELRFVLGGAASTVGSGGIPGMLRNLDQPEPLQEGLGLMPIDFEVFPLDDYAGELLTTCTYDAGSIQNSEVDADTAFFPHIAEGVLDAARNEFVCTDGAAGSQLDYLQKQTAMIHAVGLQAADVALMAAAGTSMIWSPRSNLSLYGFTAGVTELARAGVHLALGSDWSASGSMNLLRELTCADSFNTTYLGGFFTRYDLYRMVTEEAALVSAASAKIGKLVPGMEADVTIWNGGTKDVYDAIVGAQVGDVALVLRGGVVLFGEAPLVDALSPDGGAACEDLMVCGTASKLCAARELGKTTAQLQADLLGVSKEAYPLFFCGTPMNEPTCVPARPGEFTGIPSATDRDGDGIPDTTDLCPTVFSAIRPMDHGKQPDADGDGLGDACDPCPLTAAKTCGQQ